MQIADSTHAQVKELSAMASDWPIDVLYFADSIGSETLDDIAREVGSLCEGWQAGNLSLALLLLQVDQ